MMMMNNSTMRLCQKNAKHYEIQKEMKQNDSEKKHKPWTMQCENHNENHNGINIEHNEKWRWCKFSKKQWLFH